LKFYDFKPDSWNASNPLFIAAGDTYHSTEITEQVKKFLLEKQDDLIHEKMESPTHQLSDAVERYETFGLWGESRLVDLKLDQAKFKDEEKDLLLKTAQGEETGNFLIIRCPGIQSSNWLKELKQHVFYVDCQIGKTQKNELRQWLVATAANRGLMIDKGGAFEMIQRLGDSVGVLENALILLELSNQNQKNWDAGAISEFFFQETQNNAFDLADALSNRDLKRSLNLAESIFQKGGQIVELIGALRLQFRRLLMLKLHQGQWNRQTTIQKLGIPPFFYDKTLQQANRFVLPKLKKIYTELYNLDRDSKMLSLNEKDIFEMFILRLFFGN
jgi:DNA polymerase-3 subunit delta